MAEQTEKDRKSGARSDRIVPDWLGGLAVGVAIALAAVVLYFTYA